MKLPTRSAIAGPMVSSASRARMAPKTTPFHFPRLISPGLKLPVTVVYRRREMIHRCRGMMTAMTTSVRDASTVAPP